MQKKILLQIFLFLIVIITSIIFFKFYFKSQLSTKAPDSEMNTLELNKNNVMSNIKYLAADKTGNKYIIESKFAEFDANQSDIILMRDVNGTLKFNNSSQIFISSEKAIYNKLNHDTKFSENVLIDYDEHQISSHYLDFSFENNVASVSKNIIYKSLNTELRADRMEIDLITKNSKIFMDEKIKKVKVLTLN